ncbi:MAG: hypothetical protein ABSF55_00560 [Candidatus Staskawiczbacteria bacterium]|jgi:hypothetical protein
MKTFHSSKIKGKTGRFLLLFKSRNREKGLAFIPVLIWGGIALIGLATAWWAGKSALSQATVDFIAGLLTGVGDIIYYICRFLCWTATDIFDTALNWLLNKDITTNPAFVAGWNSVRGFSNMLVVLGFVVIGIATALRMRDYEAKKLLIPLIIMALLINFSGLFCGLIIDGSNILTKGLISQGGVNNAGTEYYNMVVNFANKTFASDTSIYKDNTKYFIADITVAFIWFVVAATFFYLAIIFIARYAVLAFLFVLSPLAFICRVFPLAFTKKIWTEWWENFIKWSFVGVGGALVLNISAGAMKSIGTTIDPTTGLASVNVSDLMVILLFLIIGFKIIRKSSAMGAGAVMGLAGGAMGLAMGATSFVTKKATGMGLEAMGRTDRGRRTQEWLSNAKAVTAEGMFLAPKGHAAEQRKQRAAAADKQVDAMAAAPAGSGDRNRFEQLVRRPTGALGAAAVAKANERGELGKIINPNNTAAGLNDMNRVVSHAGQFGYERKTFDDKNHQLAQFNDNKVDKALTANGWKTTVDSELTSQGIVPATATAAQRVSAATRRLGPTAMADARKKANQTQLKSNWSGMSEGERGNVDSSLLDDDFILSRKGEDLKAFRNVLPAGHATRTHIRGKAGANASSAEADLAPAGPNCPAIDAALRKAYQEKNINEIRRLKELRAEAQKLT